MATQAYWNWKNAGSPWSPATPIADFAQTMRGHGYTVYVLGADDPSHLQADLPEDHCPFSQTPWPGRQPYPRVLALDIMPGGAMDWRALGEKILADKNAGVPGTEWIKYMNYTDRADNVYHASWQSGYARRSSSDGGHIHISARTDHVDTHTAYDPFNAGGNDVAISDEKIIGQETLPQYLMRIERALWWKIPENGRGIATLTSKIDAIASKVNQPASAGGMSDAQYADLKAAVLAQTTPEKMIDALIARGASK